MKGAWKAGQKKHNNRSSAGKDCWWNEKTRYQHKELLLLFTQHFTTIALSRWTAREIHTLSDKIKAIITTFVAPFAVKQVLKYLKELVLF
jgi:hypothetical protein